MTTRFYSPNYTQTRWPNAATRCADQPVALQGDGMLRAWGAFLGRVPWVLFVTLTFDPKRVFPVNQNHAIRESIRWCNETARAVRRPLGWVVAPERNRAGQWHTHILIVGADAGTVQPLTASWRARNGRIDLRPVRDTDGPPVALYASKEAAMAGTIVLSDTIQRYLGPRHSHLARAAVPLAEADDADRNAERADAGHPQPKRKVIVRLFP